MSFHYLLMSNHMLIQKTFFEIFNQAELTPGQPKVLDYLQYHDGCIQKDIAANCHIEPASLSGILNGMEKNGYIVRKTDPSNRRQTQIHLSKKGKSVIPHMNEAFNKAEFIAFKNLSLDDQEQVTALLKKIYQNLEADEEEK